MDLQAIVEQMETGGQDSALAALQNFNKQMSQCFTFTREEEQDRQHLGQLVLGYLKRKLQPSCLLACLETVRILTRDKHCLDPFISLSAMSTLSRYAGIGVEGGVSPALSHTMEDQACPSSDSMPLLCSILRGWNRDWNWNRDWGQD
ncbi:chaperone Ric-8A-like [Xenentodon cancila]